MGNRGKRASSKKETNENHPSAVKWLKLVKGQKLQLKIDGAIHVASFIKVREDERIAVRLDTGDKFRFEQTNDEIEVKVLHDMCRMKGCENQAKSGEHYCESCLDEVHSQDMTIADIPPRKKPKPFTTYGIDWNDTKTNFKFSTDEVLYFYGI